MYRVYKLVDTTNGKCFYVGITKNRLVRRLVAHLAESLGNRDCHRAKNKLIRKLLYKNGINAIAIIKIASAVDIKEALALERKFIIKYTAQGIKLTNILKYRNVNSDRDYFDYDIRLDIRLFKS